MKKNIFISLLLIAICFPHYSIMQQTGIVTPKGESRFGVWINTSKQEDTMRSTIFRSFSIDYMFKNGLEISLGIDSEGFLIDDDLKTENHSISYHFKGKSNFSIKRGMRKFEDGDTYYSSMDQTEIRTHESFENQIVGLKWYNNNGFFIGIDRANFDFHRKTTLVPNGSFNEFVSVEKYMVEREIISIGKYAKINDRIITGIIYSYDKKQGAGGINDGIENLGFCLGVLY